MADFSINSLRGGLNNTDPANSLDADQCVAAENVEFHRSMLGEKRRGCSTVTLPAVAGTSHCVPWVFRHLPTTDESGSELWALFTPTDGSQAFDLARKTTVWATPAFSSSDTIDVTTNRHYRLSATSLHGKLFLAFRGTNGGSGVDRLHVWDGSTIRRVGLVAPVAAPAVANTGVGTFSGTRYYRVRFTVQNGSGTTILRSEPSAVTTFAPSGAGLSARITKPAASSPSEGETHWEVEASINNADFYRIATTAVGTTTYDDSISAYTTGYAASGTLSEDIGDYTLPWSAKFVATDDDRLVFAGAWENSSYASSIGWSPVTNNEGVGNDERIPTVTTNRIDLDAGVGGEITGLSRSINGYIFVFKLGRIYKISRTDNITRAYSSLCITTSRGALPGSIVEGLDESGRPCLYFCDPRVGPCRLGASGLQTCGFDILVTWATVNVDAALPVFGTFFPKKRQLHYWLATSGASTPNMRIVAQTNNMRVKEDGVRRGWSTWSSGRSCTSAYSACVYASNIEANTTRSLDLVPFVGVNDTLNSNMIQQCDAANVSDGGSYTAYTRSRPFLLGNLLNKFGVMAGAVLATTAAGVVFAVRLIRDFGVETKTVTNIDCTLTASETSSGGSPSQVVRFLDNLFNSECRALQVEIGDLSGTSGLWEVNMLAFSETPQETASGS
jgi:hypothetical protein